MALNMATAGVVITAQTQGQQEISQLEREIGRLQGRIGTLQNELPRAASGMNAVTASAGQQRAGMQQLGFQLGDAATMFSMGSSAAQIFASQLGQTLQAVQLMTGGTSRLATFLGGPWGIALSVGAMALTPFIGKLWDTVTGADTATNALQKFINKQREAAAGAVDETQALIGLNKARSELLAIDVRLSKRPVGTNGVPMFSYSDLKRQEELRWQIVEAEGVLNAAEAKRKAAQAQAVTTTVKTEAAERSNAGAVRATAVAVNELAQSFKTLQRELMPEVAALEEYRSKLEQIAKFAKSGLITGDQADDWRKRLAMKGRPTDLVVSSTSNSKLDEVAAQNIALMGERLGRGEDRSARGGSLAAIENYGADIADIGEKAFDAWQNALYATEDALVNFAMTGKLTFKDLANSIIADLVRIAIQQAIMAPLTGGFKKLFSASGTAFDTGGVRKFAKGGVVSGPTPFAYSGGLGLMGEAGPEAIMPLRRLGNGRLGVEAAGGGGGSQSVNVNVNVEGGGSQVQGDPGKAAELGRLVAGAVQSELLRQKRPGGLLAGAQ